MNGAEPRKELATTLFPIRGLAETTYKFRVLKVREKVPEDNRQPIRLQQWADRLWRQELRCPVFPTKRFGYPAFLIPEDDCPSERNSIEILDVPDRTYHVDVTDQVLEINIGEARGTERELICRMLERPFTDKLWKLRDVFWRYQWTLFYFLKPANESANQDIMNAYRGYKFGVVFVEGRGLHLAVDVKTRYVGRKSLSEFSAQEREAVLGDHMDLDSTFKDRARFLRDNGVAKFPCKYTGETGEIVSTYVINDAGETVLDYYRKTYPRLNIDPNDPAIFVKDGEDKPNLPVPASRLLPIFTTEFEGVRNCSVQPQMTPNERVSSIRDFLRYLQGVKYGDNPITVGGEVLTHERTVFIPPKLEFGSSHILQPFQGTIPPLWSERFDSQIVKWRSKKLPALYQNGPFHNEPLPGIVLLFPESMARPVRETFLNELKQEIKLQSGQDMQILQQRQYQVNRDEYRGSSLLMLATEIQSTIARCLTLAVLWNRHHKNIHGNLKDALRGTPSQCAWERTVSNICNQDNPQRAKSQRRNLTLGILTEAGVKPWVLAEPLHHDLHIGIDLLYGRVCYHFLHGKGGRIIDTCFGASTQRGKMREAIKRPDIRSQLVQSIKSIVKQGQKIKSIVIHRDGRWWPSESAGLGEALSDLKKDNSLDKDARCAVAEVRKNHMPIRLFSSLAGGQAYYQNPLPGTYFILDSNRILLTTTGRPGAWDEAEGRTASTLLFEVVDNIGDFNVVEIAEDAYRLTHLNWNAPDIDISLPVTIRWTDELLRETLQVPSQEDEDSEEADVDEGDEKDEETIEEDAD
jgi:hypothetical protein